MEQKNLPERCPNCITLLPDGSKYCPNCGQKRFDLHDRSFGHLVVESVSDFFHFDSKFTGTLIPLLIKPGFLTKEFLEGRRVRYFEPFKLFIFISFLYFFLSGILDHSENKKTDYIIRENKERKVVQMEKDTTLNKGHLSINTSKELEQLLLLPVDTLKYHVENEGLDDFVESRGRHSSWLEKFVTKGAIKDRITGSGTLYHNFQKTIPKLIFILIPIFALLFKLLYVRRKVPYYNHVIFSIHFLSFFFLMMLTSDLVGLILSWFSILAMPIYLIYLFLALNNFYPGRKRSTLWKLLLFIFCSGIIVIFFFVLAAIISFMMI